MSGLGACTSRLGSRGGWGGRAGFGGSGAFRGERLGEMGRDEGRETGMEEGIERECLSGGDFPRGEMVRPGEIGREAAFRRSGKGLQQKQGTRYDGEGMVMVMEEIDRVEENVTMRK